MASKKKRSSKTSGKDVVDGQTKESKGIEKVDQADGSKDEDAARERKSYILTGTNYRDTQTYKDMDADTRALLKRYKEETGITNEHLFYQLYLKDLENVPVEERKARTNLGEWILVIETIFMILVFTMDNDSALFSVSVVFLITFVYYVTGHFDPYTNETKRVSKMLKKMDEVPDFEEWRSSASTESALEAGQNQILTKNQGDSRDRTQGEGRAQAQKQGGSQSQGKNRNQRNGKKRKRK